MRYYFKKSLVFANWRIIILQFVCASLFALSLQNLVQNAVDWAQISLRLSTMWLAVLGGIAVWQVQKMGNRLRRLAGPAATQPHSPENDLAHIEQRLSQLDRTQTLAHTQLRETAAQDERNRLARDLHDTIKQQLFSINMAAATAQSLSETDPTTAREMLDEVRNLSQQAQVEMRAMLTQLRPQPLATVGLVQALRDQLEALHFRSEVQTELIGDALPDESQLPLGAQEALFRVAQEALSNVARHARAKTASITLSHTPSTLTLAVTDDGQGFDTRNTKAGMGLSNMRTRITEIGGELDLDSALNSGTRIHIRVPLAQPQQPMVKTQKTSLAFILVWFGLGIVNGIRGDWLGMALAFTLGTGLVISRDADLNNWRDVRKSPRQMLGLALAVIALAVSIAQVGYDFGRSLRP